MEIKFILIINLLICGIFVILSSSTETNDHQVNKYHYYITNIHGIGYLELTSLKNLKGVNWWIEVGDLLLLSGIDLNTKFLHSYDVKVITYPNSKENIISNIDQVAIYANSKHMPEFPPGLFNSAILLLRRGGFSIFHFVTKESMKKFNVTSFPFMIASPNLVLIREFKNEEKHPEIVIKATPGQLANEINSTRWFAHDTQLALYNRYTRGTDIARAQSWIETTVRSIVSSNVKVTTQSFSVGTTPAYNIIVNFTGTSRPNDWYIVGAHYDSTSQSPTTAAPGAEDNGSGSAGLIELIYALSKYPPAATVIIIFYSGEEQGCYGSKANVNELNRAGDASKVKLVIIMDMIAFAVRTNNLVVLYESYSRFNATLAKFAAAADAYGNIGSAFSYNPFGSDHMPYLTSGYNALLNIDYDYDSYPYYHRTTDTPNRLVPSMAYGILRSIAAVLGDTVY